jgi:hypothetical protein
MRNGSNWSLFRQTIPIEILNAITIDELKGSKEKHTLLRKNSFPIIDRLTLLNFYWICLFTSIPYKKRRTLVSSPFGIKS